MAKKSPQHSIPKSAKTVAWIKPNNKLSRAHSIAREKGSDSGLACGTSLPTFEGAELQFDHDEADPCRVCAKRTEGGDQ
jgi:hypothetical protein